ncbi:hypothetical protein C6A86_006725 [Mycobacterium sp. ITM-2016-00316]|uniref:hypothetical protein n=1 Tax=Mycobacterium sp. ITM-2016-00316 TaxID=2099695 RepID=UPI000CF981F6|nr:hypothetical protein [Mycobacterium sp. ITM-2016-00316]WNG83353.1 hypothetical protein C6A86_006725 [Mycobacterium sp. ITM-2016-00316]
MRILRGIATAALGAAVAIGCSAPSQEVAAPVSPPPPTEVHRDIPGLVKVFPGIGAPVSVAWLQWGDPAAGAADVRFTDAVVTLSPAVAEAMMTQFEPTDTGRAPKVQDALSAEVPAGPFLTGELLDAGFSSASTSTYAFLDRATATLVLQATSLD